MSKSHAYNLPNGWHKTFYTLWLGCFITGLGYSMTMPFISLFMAELGHYNKLQLNLYSGLAFAMTFIAQAIISPYWGNLADRKGRKLMCMRAAGVMSLTIFITGLAQSALFIICMRFLQGLFSGYINNATALMASETPHQRSGWVMSQMMTAGTAGNLVGPLIGGALSSALGYRIPFFITGGLMFLTFLGTWLLVKLIIIMFVTTMIVQSSTMSIDPIVSLYVKSLMPHSNNIALIAGIVAATPGLGTMLSASHIGHLMDHIGAEKVLRWGLLIATILFIPMTFIPNAWSLAFWRFLLGIVSAGLLPAAQTILTLNVPPEAFGRVFSYNQSFQAVGAVLGSLLGSTISGMFTYEWVFAATGITLLINYLIMQLSSHRQNA